jgi:DNA processing protein
MKLQGLDAWLHCLLTDGLGPARWLALMQRWGEPEAVLAARFGAGPCASTMRAVVVTAR